LGGLERRKVGLELGRKKDVRAGKGRGNHNWKSKRSECIRAASSPSGATRLFFLPGTQRSDGCTPFIQMVGSIYF
jgi:hypothetical protein